MEIVDRGIGDSACQLVGDDVFVTNVPRLQKEINEELPIRS